MQQKESKTNWHFRISILKSLLRLGACIALWEGAYGTAALGFAGAEVLGIVEEL